VILEPAQQWVATVSGGMLNQSVISAVIGNMQRLLFGARIQDNMVSASEQGTSYLDHNCKAGAHLILWILGDCWEGDTCITVCVHFRLYTCMAFSWTLLHWHLFVPLCMNVLHKSSFNGVHQKETLPPSYMLLALRYCLNES
jgi:hypothetical protein